MIGNGLVSPYPHILESGFIGHLFEHPCSGEDRNQLQKLVRLLELSDVLLCALSQFMQGHSPAVDAFIIKFLYLEIRKPCKDKSIDLAERQISEQ